MNASLWMEEILNEEMGKVAGMMLSYLILDEPGVTSEEQQRACASAPVMLRLQRLIQCRFHSQFFLNLKLIPRQI